MKIKDFVTNARLRAWISNDNIHFLKGNTDIAVSYFDEHGNVIIDENTDFGCVVIKNIIDNSSISRKMEIIDDLCWLENGFDFDIAIRLNLFTTAAELTKKIYIDEFERLINNQFNFMPNKESNDITEQYLYRHGYKKRTFINASKDSPRLCKRFLDAYSEEFYNVFNLNIDVAETLLDEFFIYIKENLIEVEIGTLAGSGLKDSSDCLFAFELLKKMSSYYKEQFEMYGYVDEHSNIVDELINELSSLVAIKMFYKQKG